MKMKDEKGIFMVITGRESLRPRSSKPSESSETRSVSRIGSISLRFSFPKFFIRARGGPGGNYDGLCSLER